MPDTKREENKNTHFRIKKRINRVGLKDTIETKLAQVTVNPAINKNIHYLLGHENKIHRRDEISEQANKLYIHERLERNPLHSQQRKYQVY